MRHGWNREQVRKEGGLGSRGDGEGGRLGEGTKGRQSESWDESLPSSALIFSYLSSDQRACKAVLMIPEWT